VHAARAQLRHPRFQPAAEPACHHHQWESGKFLGLRVCRDVRRKAKRGTVNPKASCPGMRRAQTERGCSFAVGCRSIEGRGCHPLGGHQAPPVHSRGAGGVLAWFNLSPLWAVAEHAGRAKFRRSLFQPAAELACQHHPWEQVPRQRSRLSMGHQIVPKRVAPRASAII
jgi:hypothetical protein